VTTWQQFLSWCSKEDRYPEIFHLDRNGRYVRIYTGNITFDNLLARSGE
jgi:hypothetical protein